jgi:surfeit locus 1 family protein
MSAATRRAVVLLATLAGVALTARLGVWQLDRAAQKQALQASVETRGALPPLPAAALARDATAAEAQRDRRIVLTGRWLAERTVFLDNRQMGGRPGFFVLTPLLLAPGDAVMVQRGWAPRDPRDRALLPDVPTPPGEVSVAGTVAPPPSRLYAFASEEQGRLRQNLDLGAYSREIGVALRPLSLRQQAAGAVDDGLLRDWPAPAFDVDKHHGYAFQWFALSLLLTGLYVWFQVLAPWRERRRARRG